MPNEEFVELFLIGDGSVPETTGKAGTMVGSRGWGGNAILPLCFLFTSSDQENSVFCLYFWAVHP